MICLRLPLRNSIRLPPHRPTINPLHTSPRGYPSPRTHPTKPPFLLRFHPSTPPLHLGHKHPTPDPHDGQEGRRITWVGFYSNLLLGIGKATAGIFGNSSALLADAVHTFSDLATDMVTLWTHTMARKPWSVEHPYGFGKFETIGATVISVVLIISGIGIATHSFEHLMITGQHPGQIALFAAFVSIVVKEILFQMTMAVAKRERSEVLAANAWHHRSDAISSVVAFIGVAGSILGWPLLDPLAGVIVAGLIIRAGYQIFLQSVKELTDNQSIEQETIEAISNLLNNFPDILGYHNLRSRKMGPYSLVDLHITVDPKLSVTAAHQIAERARTEILNTFPQVREALIHVEGGIVEGDVASDCYRDDYKILPSHATVVTDIKRVLANIPAIKDSDFFAVHYLGEEVHAIFAIILDNATSVHEASKIGNDARKQILTDVPYLTEVVIKLELTKSKSKE